MKVVNSESEEAKTKTPDTEKPQKTDKSLWSFFSHPVWIPIGILIGIFTSYYFFEVSKVYPQLVFYVSPVKATIVKAGQASDIKTFYKDRELNTDVTVAQVAIWNHGNASIEKEQVLQPIVLFTDDNAPILEATIKKSTREVTRLSFRQDEFQNGRLPISWNILEQNDGGVIQIIYAGDSQTNINIEGIIKGQKEVTKSTPLEKIKSPDEQYTELKSGRRVWVIYIAIPVLFLFGMYASISMVKMAIKEFSMNKGRHKYIILSLSFMAITVFSVFVLYAISGFYSILKTESLVIPFGLN